MQLAGLPADIEIRVPMVSGEEGVSGLPAKFIEWPPCSPFFSVYRVISVLRQKLCR